MNTRIVSLIVGMFVFQGCKNFGFVAPVNHATNCEYSIKGVDPKNTFLILKKDVQVRNIDDSRFINLEKGVYYPAMHWKNCRHVSYASSAEIEVQAENKLNNFFINGLHTGGIQIEIEHPEKVHSIWYYVRGTGFMSFKPENPNEIDFVIYHPGEVGEQVD